MLNPTSRVLVVDDMMTMRKIITRMLSDLGFRDCVEAADGLRAWEALTKANPPIELIVSDINMPGLTGIEFLKKIRAEAKYRNLPVIFLTAESDLQTVKSAIESNVTSYLLKPVSPVELKKKLDALLTPKSA